MKGEHCRLGSGEEDIRMGGYPDPDVVVICWIFPAIRIGSKKINYVASLFCRLAFASQPVCKSYTQ